MPGSSTIFNAPETEPEPVTASSCKVKLCVSEVFSSCHRCLILLCWDHFQEVGCESHGQNIIENKAASLNHNIEHLSKQVIVLTENNKAEQADKNLKDLEMTKKGNRQFF